jgi:hypothetical protein
MLLRVKPITDLVDHILDQLPPDVWTSDSTTFLDPAMGGGQFLAGIERRLRVHGHSTENIAARVFGYEYTSALIDIARNWHGLVGTLRKMPYNQLLKTGSGMKFDVIVGNPPFQKSDKSGRDDDNLWPKFLELAHKSVKPGGYIGMVSPASWGSLGTNDQEPGSQLRKNHFSPYQVLYVDLTASRHFPKIGSTFSSYVIRSAAYDPTMETRMRFSDKEVMSDFNSYLCFPLKHSESEFGDIIVDFSKREPYPIIQKDPYPKARYSMKKKIEQMEYSRDPSPEHPYRSYHTNAQTHLYSRYRNTFHGQWKVVFSYSGTWSTEVTDDCSLTDASMCILCDDRHSALSIQSVLQSRPVRFLISKVYLWSGYYSGSFIKMIPALPTDKIYTDDDVYRELFTKDQADLIRKKLKD